MISRFKVVTILNVEFHIFLYQFSISFLTFAPVKDDVKGTEAFPSSILKKWLTMTHESPLDQIRLFLSRFIEKSEDLFLVEVKLAPGNQITVLLDADNGITIEKCTQVNKALYKFCEENGFFPEGNFSLQVSSPGVGEPLKLHRQYKKNIGRKVEVELNEGTKSVGTLLHVNENEIILEEKQGKAKKITMKTTTILFNQIKHTIVLTTF
ncbi:MAG: ribosome maturation factor [Bacteroidota bacterium]|nr:ribosome maturation factor [Bacteroidota bacterium]